MSTIVARLYYNPSYQGCEDKPCYFIYIPNGGSFISTPEETYKTFDTFQLFICKRTFFARL